MELIAATTSALDNIGFTDFTLRINDRRLLTDMIKSAGFGDDDVMPVCIIFDKLDKIGLDGVKDELLGKGYAAERWRNLLRSSARRTMKRALWRQRKGLLPMRRWWRRCGRCCGLRARLRTGALRRV